MSSNEKALGEAMLKDFFGRIPVIGFALNEYIFDRRSRIKQDRLNDFSELLMERFTENFDGEIDLDRIKSEEFGDVFESVIQRVLKTSDRKKLERFRDILIGYMKADKESEFVETFLDITERVSEKQIEILKVYAEVQEGLNREIELILEAKEGIEQVKTKLENIKALAKQGLTKSQDSMVKWQKEIASLESKRVKAETRLDDLVARKGAKAFNLEEGEFQFYVQDLVSKSLLRDEQNRDWIEREVPSRVTTEFGFRYLGFVLSEGVRVPET